MVRASRPAMPSDDLDAARAAGGAVAAGGPVTRELADFCQSGVSVVAGTCAADGWPIAVHGCGCRIDETGAVRVLVQRGRCLPALDALAAGAGIAATFSRPTDHRSIQLKAGRATVAAADAADGATAERQGAAFRAVLEGVGFPPAFTAPFTDHDAADLAAIVFVPEEAFVQTPGPGAGSALR